MLRYAPLHAFMFLIMSLLGEPDTAPNLDIDVSEYLMNV